MAGVNSINNSLTNPFVDGAVNGGSTTNDSLILYNNTTDNEGLTIESDGTLSVNATNYETLVTADDDIPNKKYVDDAIAKVSFSAYSDTNQTINSSGVKIQLDNESWDDGGNFDATTNYRFVAPVTGYYQFDGNIGYGANGSTSSQLRVELWVNGALKVVGDEGYSPAGTWLHKCNVSCLLYLTSSQYVELYGRATVNNRDTSASSVTTYLTGFLVYT